MLSTPLDLSKKNDIRFLLESSENSEERNLSQASNESDRPFSGRVSWRARPDIEEIKKRKPKRKFSG